MSLHIPKFGTMISPMDRPMIDYVRDRLTLAKGSWPKIAKASGIPYGTLKRIYYNPENSPRLNSIEPLYNYFKNKTQ